MEKIKGLDINGRGITYINKKITFVEEALPGEVVDVKITKKERNFNVGVIKRIMKKSPNRVNPICKQYERCGGCDLMHMKHSAQIDYKRDRVVEAVNKYTKLDVKVHSTISMTNPLNYRNKAQLQVKLAKTPIVGLYEKDSHFVVDMTDCPVHSKKVNKILQDFRKVLTRHKVNQEQLSRIMIRVGEDNNHLVLIGKNRLDNNEFIDELSKISNLTIFTAIQKPNKTFFEDEKMVIGNGKLTKNLNGLKLKLRPRDFYQLNDEVSLKLFEYIKKKVSGSKSVVDCYMGVGTIGLYVYEKGMDLRGIEIVSSAVKSAKENAKANKIPVEFQVGDVEKLLPKWLKRGFRPDCMIFDPPRTGLGENIRSIEKVRPKKVIYVSCNPSTLAKDLRELKKYYRIEDIQPFDMFPQTAQVESCTVLIRKDK